MDDLTIERADWVALLTNLSLSWSLSLEIAVRALDASDPGLAQVLSRDHALALADALIMKPPEVLGDVVLWQRFQALRRLAATLLAEVVKRLEQARGVSELARLMLPPESVSSLVDLPSLELAIHIDRLTGNSASGDEKTDTQQIAMTGLLQKYTKLGERYAACVPSTLWVPSREELGLAALPVGRWDWPLFHGNKVARVLAKFGPLEQMMPLVDSAWQAVRSRRRAAKAPTRRPERGFVELDRLVQVRGAGGATPGAELEARELRERIVTIVRKRHGPNAEKYVMELFDGASPKEAARRAGITDRQGRRYLQKLKKIFTGAEK